MDETVYFNSALVVMFAIFATSLLGCIVPIIPGVALAWFAAVGFELVFPDSLGWKFLGIWGIAMFAVQALDVFFSWFGARKFGATWRGGVGAIVGFFVGMFIPPPLLWIFVAPFAGAFLLEYLGGAGLDRSLKSGVGAFLGMIASTVVKVCYILGLAVSFYMRVKNGL